jgi:GNAT superfamily N-acetyltransferase
MPTRARSRVRGFGARGTVTAAPMIPRLRPAESSDFDWMLTLPQARDEACRPLAERRTRFTRAFASRPWWVVEVDRQPVGALSVAWDDDPAVLHAVTLMPPWQGRGLGTRLVHDVLLQARERQRSVVVELPSGDPALALFRRLGFWPSDGEPSEPSEPERVRLRWEASVRTHETLRAAMSPWEDPKRRRAWARRLFEPRPDEAVGFIRFAAGRGGMTVGASAMVEGCGTGVLLRPLAALVMGCGTGGLLRPLSALGLRVTAYEPDSDCFAVATRVATVIGESTTVRAGGLLDLDEVGAHDLAIAFDGVLWSLETHAHRVDAARRLRRALRPGGILVVEGPNSPWILRADPELPVSTEIYHRATVSRIPGQELDFHDGVLVRRDTIVVEVDEEEAAEWTETRRTALLGLPELRLALEEAGLEGIETFGELGATGPERITGGRIVLTARAP